MSFKSCIQPHQERQQRKEEELISLRESIRETILTDALLEETPLVISAEFSGSGDSGDFYDISPKIHPGLHKLISLILDVHVDFDWYNHEGGGGDISWDVARDVITINGYKNIVSEEDTMVDREF